MKVNNSFILRDIYGKYILMPICINNFINEPILLNNVAAFIWFTILKHERRDEVIKIVARHFDLKQNSAELLYVETFLDNMIKMGLIKESEDTSNG